MKERPTLRTPEVDEAIVDGLSHGVTLTDICARDGMPARRTVYDWINSDADLAARIARARDLGFDVIAEQCVQIAEDGSNDYTERVLENGQKRMTFDAEHVQRSKLRIETRLKLLAKWAPKKYGDRQQVAPTTAEGDDIEFAPIMFAPRAPKTETE